MTGSIRSPSVRQWRVRRRPHSIRRGDEPNRRTVGCHENEGLAFGDQPVRWLGQWAEWDPEPVEQALCADQHLAAADICMDPI
jgi:hypothetical protein